MQPHEISKKILRILATEWEQNGPPGYIETRELVHRAGIPFGQAKAAIQALWQEGMVDTNEIDYFAVSLTPEGYQLARSIK